MNDELLPCPFCGERPVLLLDRSTVAHSCMVLDKELRVPKNIWNYRYRGIYSIPTYSDGEPIMPGDTVRHPDMYGSRKIIEIVLGPHGWVVRSTEGFETLRYDLFERD